MKAVRSVKNILLVANGDLRQSANQTCWPAQVAMENKLAAAVASFGYKLTRAHQYKPEVKNGFIASQKEGLAVFAKLDPNAPLIVAEAVWQYSHHLLAGLMTHRGPILTVANWSGAWPGLVGMLNLNGSLTKAAIQYSTLWSENFRDPFFRSGLRQWLEQGTIPHDQSHVRDLDLLKIPADDQRIGRLVARTFREKKAIMGVFDEGCMGMFNAIIPDELLYATGLFKERLSQSTLFAAMLEVHDNEAAEVLGWLRKKGMAFKIGPNPETDLTEDQLLDQCKMYVAAVRLADEFGCSTIGIQYQQGLKDLAPASDLVEGMLNNTDRPPVSARNNGRVLYEGRPLPHFNEVDECAGLDGLVTNRIWTELGFRPETTLHDVRYGESYQVDGRDEFVWVFEISGAVPPAHLIGEYAGAVSERQPPMYFRLGGGSLKGISRPGEIVWSRIYIEDGRLKMDLGRGGVVALPREETQRRWDATTPQWPIMHAVTYGVSRDQMMARHKANHVQIVYANSAQEADRALMAKASMADAMGMDVYVCGTRKNGRGWE